MRIELNDHLSLQVKVRSCRFRKKKITETKKNGGKEGKKITIYKR